MTQQCGRRISAGSNDIMPFARVGTAILAGLRAVGPVVSRIYLFISDRLGEITPQSRPAKRRLGPLLVGLSALVLAGCSPQPITNMPDGRPGSTFADKESPMLARLVKEGKLPPLSQRLPKDPMVIQPLDSLGEYGGTWHTMVENPDMGLWRCVGGYDPLMRWKPDCNGVEPDLASSWSYNSDGTQLTIHLRRGVRWSDGRPFTSDDLAYWMSICATGNSQTTYPPWSLIKQHNPSYSCPDKYTFVLKFAGANWYAPLHMAAGFSECGAYLTPKHYLIQFDPRFNPKYKDFETFDSKNQFGFNPDLPTLCPWRLTAIQDAGFRMLLERNPYFYMVDSAGRQLPYIDKIICQYVPDPQIRVLKVLSGEMDGVFEIFDLRDLDLFERGQKNGHYRLLKWPSQAGADEAFMVDWSPPDPVIRKLVRDVRFRKALSLGIDRDRCNQVAISGLDTPMQATISEGAWHFKVPGGRKAFEDWAHAYARFDIPAGNKLLDQMGLTKRDAQGYRLRPDGKRLSLTIDLPPGNVDEIATDESTIVQDGWNKMGIEVMLHNFPGAQWSLRQTLSQYEISPFGESDMDLYTLPDWVFPTRNNLWHGAVGQWYMTDGKKGEAPTGICKQLIDIYTKALAERNLAKSQQLMLKAVRLQTTDGFFCLGTCGGDPSLAIVKDNMRNVPVHASVLGSWATPNPAMSFPETFYFSSGAPAPKPPQGQFKAFE